MTALLLGSGFLLLVVGAEGLVRGAVRLAAASGISSLVIGLTVVAFGTSAPELAVSVGAGLGGQADIAVGNVVGSNILNVLLILGLSALIVPLTVARQLVRLDVPVMIGVSLLTWLLALNGRLGRLEGALLATGLVVYVVWSIRVSRRQSEAVPEGTDAAVRRGPLPWSWWVASAALTVGGLAVLVVGARLMVDGAVALARGLGVSELIIGLTVIAAGTSLPEVATSVMAALRGERDIAVGNVVGSNIFNLLGVLGLTAMVSPRGIGVAPAALGFDLPVMLAVAVACLPVFLTGFTISRAEGALLLGYYVAYVTYLSLHASGHAAEGVVGAGLLWFALPLTALGLGLTTWRVLRPART
ncbi:MAG: calcium/sodium antiporter [Thermoanaerobaculaceae bacterium]|jgi:cation:H+ antiporter|nr:calcium/sodium antiporter [Thermoanaerobaculaceae bacterium]